MNHWFRTLIFFLFVVCSGFASAEGLEPKVDAALEKLDVIVAKLDQALKPGGEVLAPAVAVVNEPATSMEVSREGRRDLDMVFVFFCAALVFLMQAGFCLVELGCVRAKNCLNVVMKNTVDFCIAMLCFLFLGFSLMFGPTLGGWIGGDVTWLSSLAGDASLWTFWIFQAVFVATAATITSGAMAERTKFVGYVFYTILISAILYPVLGHWAWAAEANRFDPSFGNGGDGWLGKLGFADFAGSTVVHGVGGACALAGIIVVGPRKGRFSKSGKPLLLAGHNIPLVALGTLILMFGWLGFNCGSLLEVNGQIGRIAVNTLISGAAGGLAGMLFFWFRDGRPDPLSSLNGILGGLVAVTASCNVVTPVSAVLIGAVAGLISTAGNEALLKFKLDDVVGAVPVHLFNGIWGTLCVAIFHENGFLISRLGTQALGAVAIMGTAFVVAFLAFKLIDKTVGLRATEEEEEDGLDYSEHASNAYPDFTTD